MTTVRSIAILLIYLSFTAVNIAQAAPPDERICSYTLSVWNVRTGNISHTERISHSYNDLTEQEIDPASGCTVCEEDQTEIHLPGVNEPFMICSLMAPTIKQTLLELINEGQLIEQIRGYRPVRSRGTVDAEGNRTKLSNHSYGTAIDINRHLNGLYTDCINFDDKCKLILGGRWIPGKPGVLTRDGPIVTAIKKIGLLWGGEIAGRQKDFMHFSITGY